MFLNHATAFTAFKPVDAAPKAISRTPRRAAFAAGTMIDTASGWRPVESLSQGDVVQTFDGGLVALASVSRQNATPSPRWHVPAGALDNCAEFELTEGQFVGLRGRVARRLFGVPLVLAPALALAGFRGIARAARPANPLQVSLAFAEEEIAMAQTGTLLHVPGLDDSAVLHRLSYGETRALLRLIDPLHCAPDLAAA